MADVLDFTKHRLKKHGLKTRRADEPVKTYHAEILRYEDGKASCILKGLPIDISDAELSQVASDMIDCALSIAQHIGASRAEDEVPGPDDLIAALRLFGQGHVKLSIASSTPTLNQLKWIKKQIARSYADLVDLAMKDVPNT